MASRVPQKGAPRVPSPRASAPKESSADIARPRRQSTASFSVRAGERIIHVFPNGTTSSGGSASVRSPISSGGSQSPSSSDSSWDRVDDDDIDPSDSASRSRVPASRRPTVEAPRPPARRHSSRRDYRDREREERSPPRRQSSRHQSRHESRHDRRHERSSSRRVHSDGSSSAGTVADDYPYHGHHGMPRAQYPGYRHVPPGSHGGYPPTMASGPSAGYPDQYHDPRQALVATRQDPFGYPAHANPFAAHGAAPPNPFSPMTESTGYFAGAPEPPMSHMGPPPSVHRHPSEADMHGRRPRPQSFAAASPYGPPDQAMMPYQTQGYPSPYGVPYGMPGYPMYPPPMGMPAYHQSPANSPPPKEPEKNKDIEALKELLTKKKEEDTKDQDVKNDEISALKELIKKHEQERAAREKQYIAEKEAEAAARAAEKAKAEEEKKRKQEIAEASKKAKEDAEKKADEAAKKAKDEAEAAAKKAKEEHEKKLADAEKAKEESEKAKKALEEQIEKSKPTPDSQKAPIRFKDAVGRKFSFPWSICKTWKGMETLIKQAFLHVDMIGDHVHQGHYDLTGPDGEIILPQIWDSMIQPDWEVTMHLWPMEEEKKPPKDDPITGLHDPFANLGIGGFSAFDMGPEPSKKGGKKGKDVGKKSSKKPGSPETMMFMPPPPPGHHGMPPPPPPGPGGAYPDPFGGIGSFPPGISPVLDKPSSKDKTKARSKSIKSKEISPLAAWFAGGNLAARPKKR
ncbi:hypothetical protein Slin15195_G108670 [Septoria linicola]|uniref:Ubiquitin-like domain-containing protein n=1 Tax=Septoria linicola TaxID=215465 RepID=A0A9Q9B262_9PEZI|nr:hypothetical protein Slin14017_G106970 [Septoria linicola]USW57548.1 hypothetical protein Slin15195_G108670 [Septoria linicola]